MNVEVNVKDRILRAVGDVFTAIVEPAQMSQFFISSASGPIKAGERVEWRFADVDRTLVIDVRAVDHNRKIVFDWTGSGVVTQVTITLDPRGNDATLVAINEASWATDADGIRRALGQTHGWADFLCCMKAYLQHGINLRRGRSKDDH